MIKNTVFFQSNISELSKLISAFNDLDQKTNFTECLPHQKESMGFSSPLGDNEKLMFLNRAILGEITYQKRKLTNADINRELQNRVAPRPVDKLSSVERIRMRDEIEQELLPRAFLQDTKVLFFINTDGTIGVCTASLSVAERTIKFLSECLGDTLQTKVAYANNIEGHFLSWITKTPPAYFRVGDYMQWSNESRKTTFTGGFDEDEIENAASGYKLPNALELVWDDRLSFVITNDLVIKSIKVRDLMKDQIKDRDKQGTLTFLVGEISDLYKELRGHLS